MANNVHKPGEYEEKSNLKSKLFIVIVFLIAITFAVLAGILSFQNKKLEKRLIDIAWKAELRLSNSIIEDQMIQAPQNSAEYIGAAKEISDIIREYYLRKEEGKLKDDRVDRREMQKNIKYTLNNLGIYHGYESTPEYKKTYKPRKTSSKKKKKVSIYYEVAKVKFTKPVPRAKIIQFIMNVEDKYPFVTAQYLKLYRDRTQDQGDNDDWKGEVNFIWFFTDSTSL